MAIVAVASFELALNATACSEASRLITDAGVDVSTEATSRDGPTTDTSHPMAHDARADSAHDAAKDASDSETVDGGTPFLTELLVTSPDAGDSGSSFHDSGPEAGDAAPNPDSGIVDAASPLALVPPFSPDIFDYYVRCEPGANPLTVSMAASPGSRSLLVRPTASPSLPSQTLTLSLYENQAIVAAATDGTATTEYWVRCLPQNFPMLKMTANPDASAPPVGYYLVGNLHAAADAGGYAMVLDGNGVPVWYFLQPTRLGVCDVDDVVDGGITFVPTTAGVSDIALDPFETHTLSPLAITYAAPTGISLDEHELQVVSSSRYLVLADPLKTGVDLSGLGFPLPDGGSEPLGPNSDITDCEIVEFDPTTGAVTWKWFATDHFAPALDSTFPQPAFGVYGPGGKPVWDPYHCNSIDIDRANGNLLVSARQMDSVFYIERSTGTVLWKMGGKAASLDGARYVSMEDPFYRQHDARLQPSWSAACNGGSGQVSVFDDETSKPSVARGVVYDVVVGDGDGGTPADGGCADGGVPDGGVSGTARVAWQYKGSRTVDATGSFRILPDGSRVIGWGTGTTPGLVFTEVDEAGTDLLDFEFTDKNTSYRAIKVPTSTFPLETLRTTTGIY